MPKPTKEPKEADDLPEADYVEYCSLSVEQIRTTAGATDEDSIRPFIVKKDILKVEKMSVWAETLCVFFFGVHHSECCRGYLEITL